MKTFIIGYVLRGDLYQEFQTEAEAEAEAEDWCLVIASSLSEAIEKYEETLAAWRASKKGL